MSPGGFSRVVARYPHRLGRRGTTGPTPRRGRGPGRRSAFRSGAPGAAPARTTSSRRSSATAGGGTPRSAPGGKAGAGFAPPNRRTPTAGRATTRTDCSTRTPRAANGEPAGRPSFGPGGWIARRPTEDARGRVAHPARAAHGRAAGGPATAATGQSPGGPTAYARGRTRPYRAPGGANHGKRTAKRPTARGTSTGTDRRSRRRRGNARTGRPSRSGRRPANDSSRTGPCRGPHGQHGPRPSVPPRETVGGGP